LTTLNNSSYTTAGDSDLPSTATSANGVFRIKGNFMSPGSWSSNANQAGLNLAYYDAPSTTAPASIEWTASRPLTSWVWDAASQEGLVANAVMQLDQTSQLMLYPQANAQSDSLTAYRCNSLSSSETTWRVLSSSRMRFLTRRCACSTVP
jgi:hypothetical protein